MSNNHDWYDDYKAYSRIKTPDGQAVAEVTTGGVY